MFVRFRVRRAAARYVLAATIVLCLASIARPAGAQGAAPSETQIHTPTAAEILLAKQILNLKHAQNIFQPLVRGVIIKTRDMFMQSNFMWSKDLNEVTAAAPEIVDIDHVFIGRKGKSVGEDHVVEQQRDGAEIGRDAIHT